MRKFLECRFPVPVFIWVTLALLAVLVKVIEEPVPGEFDRRLDMTCTCA